MSMSNIKSVNSNAEMVSRGHALAMNIASAKGLQDVVKTNLGPKGTLKMCVCYLLQSGPPPSVPCPRPCLTNTPQQ